VGLLDRGSIERALHLNHLGHELMKWLGNVERTSGPSFDRIHHQMSVPEAAREWVTRNYATLPVRCRPAPEDLASFANLVGTYLETSFELVPDRRRFDSSCGCMCPMCAAFVDIGSLKTRTLDRHDKEDARRLLRVYLRDRAAELDQTIDDELAETTALRDSLAMAAWARELLHRLDGHTAGPAVLALWRMFAWLPTGSPKPDFTLTTDDVMEADAAVTEAIQSG
jgi:hypothetical protein